VQDLEAVAAGLRLTPGADDLVRTLKEMGFRLALISGGFTFFTDRLKTELGFDYTYANRLVIREGVLTGEVEGEIIDMHRKGEILRELAEREGLKRDEVVAVGDGANDQIMIKNAGLGIAFNAKEILKRAASGSLSKENLKGILYALGATEHDLRR
jgi:phosphoserine phosphatase